MLILTNRGQIAADEHKVILDACLKRDTQMARQELENIYYLDWSIVWMLLRLSFKSSHLLKNGFLISPCPLPAVMMF